MENLEVEKPDEDASIFPESARAAHGGSHILFLSLS
jgi:hypothetical protein